MSHLLESDAKLNFGQHQWDNHYIADRGFNVELAWRDMQQDIHLANLMAKRTEYGFETMDVFEPGHSRTRKYEGKQCIECGNPKVKASDRCATCAGRYYRKLKQRHYQPSPSAR